MAKGAEAKDFVTKKIREIFQDDFIGSDGKKIYVWSTEGGEPMQVAISLTCPKVPFQADGVPAGAVEVAGGFDWSLNESAPEVPVEITQEEKDNIQKLMVELGLK